MTIANVKRNLRVRSVDVRVILADKCYYVCSVCKDVHEEGKCPIEQFYNIIRQWYVSSKHAGMLPEQAEKILI